MLLAFALYGLTAIFYLPFASWLVEQTLRQDQLQYPLIVLGLAGLYIIHEKRHALRPNLRHDTRSLGLLVAAYVLLLLSWLVHPVGYLALLLLFVSMTFALASAIHFCFGVRVARAATTLLIGFVIIMLLAVVLQALDWPLRSIAGRWSAWLLGLLGNATELFMLRQGGQYLILNVNGQPFHVAQECNGFGLLGSSLLLSVLLVTYFRVRLGDGFLLVLASVPIALFGNVLRIIGIVLLAPIVGKSNYLLMHEIVGLFFFYGTLIFLWWLIQGFTHKAKSSS